MKSFSNSDLEQEVDEFFEEYSGRIENVFDQLGSEPKRVCEDASEDFLRQRDKVLQNFENHLAERFAVLKEMVDGVSLSEMLNAKIEKLISDEEQMNKDLEELLNKKEKLREMIDVKSNMVKESIKTKKDIERICSGTIKDEFVSLCKFMNLKFQWEKETEKAVDKEKEKKFSIIFLSDSSEDFKQVKKVEIEKLLHSDQAYLKRLRDQFKIQVQQIIK